MELQKICIALLALMLAAMVIVPLVSAADTKDVDASAAQRVAEIHMKEMSKQSQNYADWNTGSVQLITEYYDLNNKKTAYQFNVNVNGENAGYILISATRENYPVLEFSHGKVPATGDDSLARSDNIVKSSVKNSDLKIGTPKMLYLGNTFYYAQYPVINPKGETVETKMVDLSDHSVVDPKKLTASTPGTKTDPAECDRIRVAEADAEWNSFDNYNLNTMTSGSTAAAMASGSKYIPGVPLYSQPNTNWCSPTSAGMVMSYWDTHGYPNIPDNSLTLINELAGAMWTTPLGTYRYFIDDGMNTVSSNHGYSYNSLHFEEDSSITFSKVTTEVNAYKPFVLSMEGGGTAYGRNQAYGSHSVAVIGYESYPGGNYVVVQDTWTPLTAVSLSYGNWASAVADYSRPN